MVKNVSYCWTDILLKEQTSARFTTKNNVRIKSHNKNILGNDESKSSKTSFIYRDNKPCPLNDNCLHQRVICIQVIPRNELIYRNHSHYTRLTETSFKDRLYQYKNSFKYENRQNATELSNFKVNRKKTKLTYHAYGVY